MSMRKRESGAALMSVIFLIVIIGALGAFAIQSGKSQNQSINLSLLEARADAAALMGIEYVGNRLAANPANCPAGPLALPAPRPPGMDNLTIIVACGPPSAFPDATRDITVTARFGVFGNPDYVQREQTRRFSAYAVGNWTSPAQGRY